MTPARHVFHAPTSGWDRIHAWGEATGEPAFVWGRGSGAHDRRWFGALKRAFRSWLEEGDADCRITFYHDGIGADALGPLDPAPHKVLVQHHWFPRWERNFEWLLRCTGKVMVATPEHAARLHEQFAWIPERFIHAVVPPRLSGPEALPGAPAAAGQRTGVWLHGQRWRRHGNRLRAVVDRWTEGAGQLEIITDGGGAPRWARAGKVVWNTGMPFEFALQRLFTWDAVLLLNDFSLDAPWLLRALELGCFPLVPDGGGPARGAAWQADSAPRPYAWGDTAEAVELLRQWRADQARLLPAFRAWAHALVEAHPARAGFADEWEEHKSALLAQRVPRLRARRPAASWRLVGWYERVQRLRAGL
jgi:hypothetical protein